MTKKSLLKISAIALAVGLLSGCATTDQLKQMQADIAKAQQTADAAMAAANRADSNAGAAMSAARAAQASADECAERCDRIMNKAMAK